jgi:hypothetical protein
LLDVSNNFETGIGLRELSGTRHRDSQPIGAYVCKFGMTTDRTCGNIESKNYSMNFVTNSASTFIRVDGGNVDLGAPGDSGGPWYVENLAYGTSVARLRNTDDGRDDVFYMAINYISSLGVSVLTFDPPGPTCNFCSVTLAGADSWAVAGAARESAVVR